MAASSGAPSTVAFCTISKLARLVTKATNSVDILEFVPVETVDPITPDEVADCILFALTRPLHVNVDEIVIKALQQSSGARIVRHGE